MPDRLAHRGRDRGHRGDLDEPQDLDELPLAAWAHARFEEPAHLAERRRQIPALERRRLVERARLHLQKGEVVQRIEEDL